MDPRQDDWRFDRKLLGERIRWLCRLRGMSLRQLAKRVTGAMDANLDNAVRGLRYTLGGSHAPRIETLYQISRVLQVSIDHLLHGAVARPGVPPALGPEMSGARSTIALNALLSTPAVVNEYVRTYQVGYYRERVTAEYFPVLAQAAALLRTMLGDGLDIWSLTSAHVWEECELTAQLRAGQTADDRVQLHLIHPSLSLLGVGVADAERNYGFRPCSIGLDDEALGAWPAVRERSSPRRRLFCLLHTLSHADNGARTLERITGLCRVGDLMLLSYFSPAADGRDPDAAMRLDSRLNRSWPVPRSGVRDTFLSLALAEMVGGPLQEEWSTVFRSPEPQDPLISYSVDLRVRLILPSGRPWEASALRIHRHGPGQVLGYLQKQRWETLAEYAYGTRQVPHYPARVALLAMT